MIRAGIYNRCSTDEEAQLNALEIQVIESREVVNAMGWVVSDQYIESESGTTSYKRSEYQRLLEDMETDKFDIVVIKSIDRLMRSARDWYIFVDKLTQNRKRLYIYIDRKFYAPEDSLITGIKAILAEDFSRELSKKIKNAHKRRQQKMTGWNITSPMFGWDKVGKNEFVINEEEAASYRLAFALVKEGKGFHSIAKIMYENGVRSKRGNRIDGAQWRNMIYASRAHGTMVMHMTEYDFETKQRIYLPEQEWIYVENALPPIVSKEYQMSVIQILESRKQKKETVKRVHILSGKLYCAECGKLYYRVSFVSGNNKVNEWKCSTKIHQGRKNPDNTKGCDNPNVLEECIFETIGENCKKYMELLFGTEEEIKKEAFVLICKMLQKENPECELVKLEKELDKLKRRKNILMTKLAEEVIDDIDFKNANQMVSEKITHLQEKINDMKKRTDEQKYYEKRLQGIKATLSDEVVEKAKIFEFVKLIEKIVIHSDDKMEIHFRSEKEFRIVTEYKHKTNTTRKREILNRRILMLFKENPNLMLKNVPAIIGMGESYVNASVKELKEKGMLRYERNGNTHTGRWVVNDTI